MIDDARQKENSRRFSRISPSKSFFNDKKHFQTILSNQHRSLESQDRLVYYSTVEQLSSFTSSHQFRCFAAILNLTRSFVELFMADNPSSITTTDPRPPKGSLPAEYQIRPPHLPATTDSPLTGIAANPYRPRSIWYELWKSKLAFFLFVGSTTLMYLDYQRTQRYKAQKALNAASEQKEKKK